MQTLRTLAPAKLNLTLEVLGRREDGFHDLASIAQTIDLADVVELWPASATPGVTIVDGSGRPVPIPFGDELVAKAWDLLVERHGVDRDVAVRVTKSIPIAGGLGGGSSDAAAFLRLAQRHWGLPGRFVYEIARDVGSDVALFLAGGTALMEGRGERITRLPDAAASVTATDAGASTESLGWAALIYTPELPVPASKTAAMFGALRPTHFRGDERTVELGAALVRGDAPAQDDCWNTFDLVAGEVLMGLTDARRRVAAATQQVAVLAGAGPSLFLLGEPGALEAAAGQLNAEGSGRARLVQPLSREAATHVEQRPDEVATAGEA